MPNETKQFDLRLSVLLHRDGSAWVAQCLEHDVAAQGPTPEEAKRRFLHTLSKQILTDLMEGRAPLADLDQAPERYFDDSAETKHFGPELPVYVRVPPKLPRVAARAQFISAEA